MSQIASEVEITRLLSEVVDGKHDAKQELLARVYQQLRKMALREMKGERNNHTWGATVLAHEAYLRLMKTDLLPGSRRYFFFAAGRAMRQLLVEHARKKRLDSENRVFLDDVVDQLRKDYQVSVLDLDQALLRLKEFAPRQHDVVELRFFSRLRWKEIAEHLGIAVTTAEKDWQFARAWLFRRLRGGFNES